MFKKSSCMAVLAMTSVSAIRQSAPDFVQTDIESDPICSSAGCTQYKHKTKGLGYKINYPVPNFGKDHDIVDNHGSLSWAENSLNHKWTWKEIEPEKDPVTYYDAGPLENDVASTMKHLNE